MGTTLVMAWVVGSGAHISWVGDSRCYRLSPADRLQLLTNDHSVVWQMVMAGELTPEQAGQHDQRNTITQSLGLGDHAPCPDYVDLPQKHSPVIVISMIHPFRLHDRYRLLENLGGGELSEVWRAKDELTDKEIVVKIYVRVGDAGIRQFKNDFNLTYNLNQAYILKPDHMDVYDRRPYLLMPYLAQGSSFRRIDTTVGSVSLFTEQEAARLMVQIGGALA